MGAETDSNEEKTTSTAAGGGAPVRTGKVSDIGGAAAAGESGKLSHDGEEKKSPMATSGSRKEGFEVKGIFGDDDIASTLAAASEKLQKAHENEQAKRKLEKKKKRKPSVSRCVATLHPKRLFSRLRDLYVNGCLVAADKIDFADLASGAPAMYYADTTMSRNVSQRRDREREEIMQASLSRQQSRQQSANVSRNASTRLSGLSRNASTGFPGGLNRNTSTGLSGGLSRNASTGLSELHRQTSRRTPFVRSSPSRKNSELFSAGRASFVQQHQNSASSLARFGETNPLSSLNSSGTALSKTEFRPDLNVNKSIKEEVVLGSTPK